MKSDKWIIILLFIYIYVPPFFSFSMAMLLSVCSIAYFIVNYKQIKRHININGILKWLLLLILLLGYSQISYIVNGGNLHDIIKNYSNMVYIISYTFLGAIMLCDLFWKRNFDHKRIWKSIIIAGIIQAFLSVLAYTFSDIQTILCELLSNIMDYETISYWRNYRLYGLSGSLTYGMPIVQAIIGGMALVYAKKYNFRYYFSVPFLWMSGLINARISMIIIALEIVIFFFYCIKNKVKFKLKKNTVVIFAVISILLIGTLLYIFNSNSINFNRITDPILEIWSLIHGKIEYRSEGYLAYLFRDEKAFYIPNGWQILFGGGVGNNRSDIGYIYDLWLGGLIYCFITYFIYLILIKRIYGYIKKRNRSESLIIMIFGITLFIVNIKGYVFSSMNDFINLFYLVLSSTILVNYEKDKERI